jgi:hypothetical protein
MPLEFFAKIFGTSQVVDMAGKAPMTSAPPVSPMTQIPQYSTTTTVRPVIGNFQMPTFQTPNANASADLLPTQQRFITQASYVHPVKTTYTQPAAEPVPMNANAGCTGQCVFPRMTQQMQ